MDVVRPLTAQEEIYWKLTFNDQIHPTLTAHVTGMTTPGQWRDALGNLQQRHPLLRVSVEMPVPNLPGPTQPFFRRRSNAQIPLKVLPYASVSRWEAEIERELAIPFHPGDAPLVRAVLIHDPRRSIFTLAVSHSISDGMSLSYLMRDVLAAVAGQKLIALEFPRSAEQRLGLSPAAPASAVSDAPDGSKVRSELPVVQSLRFSEPLTERLIDTSRRHRTTVHGVLAAAFVLAMRRQAPRFQHEPVRMISPVNIRSMLGVGEECGMYFTSPKALFDPAEPTTFWDMARLARQSIVNAATPEALVAVTQAMQGMTAAGLTKAAAADTLNHAFAIDILLTNIGRTPYGSAFGHLHLESLWPAVLGGLPTIQTVGASSTNGRLCLMLTSREPIPLLLETAQTILSDACMRDDDQ